jgi:hypothetical protein
MIIEPYLPIDDHVVGGCRRRRGSRSTELIAGRRDDGPTRRARIAEAQDAVGLDDDPERAGGLVERPGKAVGDLLADPQLVGGRLVGDHDLLDSGEGDRRSERVDQRSREVEVVGRAAGDGAAVAELGLRLVGAGAVGVVGNVGLGHVRFGRGEVERIRLLGDDRQGQLAGKHGLVLSLRVRR